MKKNSINSNKVTEKNNECFFQKTWFWVLKEKRCAVYRGAYCKNAAFFRRVDEALNKFNKFDHLPTLSEDKCTSIDSDCRLFLLEKNYVKENIQLKQMYLTPSGRLFILKGGFFQEAVNLFLHRLICVLGTLGSIAAIVSCCHSFCK